VALWQTNTARGKHLTKGLFFLFRNIAKKDEPSLTRLLAAQLLPAVAPVAVPNVAPVAARYYRKLSQTVRIECAPYMLIWLLQVT